VHTQSESISSAPIAESAGIWHDVRDAIRGSEHDYTAGPIGRAIFLLAVPMVIEMGMESIFAVVDVFFVGKLGADAVATVGLTESLMIILYTIAFGLSIGATATVSRRIGEKDADGAARAAVQVLLLGAMVSAVVGIVGTIYAPQLLALMGASPDVIAVGTPFARVMIGGNASVFLLFLINAVFRGAGDPAVAMRALIFGNSINIVLDPLLIFGVGPFPEMGLVGAAVATVFARGMGFAFALWLLTKGTGHLKVGRKHLAVEPATMWSIAKLSGSGTLQVAIGSLSWIGLVRVVSGFGSEAMAGYTIAVRIFLFALMPAFGIGAAAATMVGQALGAKKPDRAEAAVWRAAKYNAVFLTLTGLTFFIFAPLIVGWFSSDPAVTPVATFGLRAVSCGFPFFALGMVLEQAFNGAGDTWTPTWINLGIYWVLQIPLAWLLASRMAMGADGVFVAVSIAYSMLAVVAAILFKRGRWKLKHV
jgi:putative MATE family efflux protein